MIQDTILAIRSLDSEAMEKCQIRLDNLTKPINSLYALEHLARQLAGITGQSRPHSLQKSIILMAADHGVADEAISAYPKEFTAQMIEFYCSGGAAVNIFATHVHANLVIVDMGVAADFPALTALRHEKIAYGTGNIRNEPAMSREQTIRAIETGIRISKEEIYKGARAIGLGEMGIANTTVATAIVSSYSGMPVRSLTGRGSGISEETMSKKIIVIEEALARHKPDLFDPIDMISKLGGFEIAGLVGVILGAAANRSAIVLDSLVTAVAALLAVKLAPQCRDYLIGSQLSLEPAHQVALDQIGISAYLHLDMLLGEGVGAALGMSLINASLQVLNDMKTFGEAEVAVAQDGPGALKQTLTDKGSL